MNKKRIIVTAAIIYNGNQILITKRKPKNKMPGGWEFPGGKIELYESPETCVKRELMEELNIEVDNINIFHALQHEYENFHLIMIVYKCNIKSSSKIILHEHEKCEWLDLDSPNWSNYSFMDADIPIIEKLFMQNVADTPSFYSN